MQHLKKAVKTAESHSETIRPAVEKMLADIRADREKAVEALALKFDNWTDPFILSEEKKQQLIDTVPDSVKEDIRFAHQQVSTFAKAQRDSIKEFETQIYPGVRLGQRIIPMDVAGCYIPGGRFAHACSAVMSVATAKAAGVKTVIAASPPRGKSIDPAVAYAMDISGADIILEMGGVQAIASMAFGLFTGNPANILAGPGNAYVAEAKALLAGSGVCAIDVFAGPTESAVIADDTADPMTIAVDLVSQAEHGYDSPVWLFTDSRQLGEQVLKMMPQVIDDLPAPEVAAASWRDYGEIILCDDWQEMAAVSDQYAPEHVQVMTKDNQWWCDHLTAYGSRFIGDYCTVAQGDKCSGTNHILPTRKAGYYSGGLNVHKFLKICTFQEIEKQACLEISSRASRLSRVEGMEGHARACDWRLKKFFPDQEWDFNVYSQKHYS